MTKTLSSLAASMIALGLVSSPASAASSRTFVSAVVGSSDAGTCTVTTPCRTFAFALTQTSPSGEIIVLGSGGYGAVTINKSVSIINTSSFAGVTAASGDGITINAGTSDAVTLRGITVDGGGTGANGIVFNSGGKLTIDQCDVMNFVGSTTAGNGILIQPTSGSHNILITNTTTSNNGWTGVNYNPPSGSATTGMVIDRVSANNNGYGIVIQGVESSGATTAAISNSIASFNTQDGFYFFVVTASLDSSNASNNVGDGVFTNSETTLALGRSVLMNNSQYGLSIGGGTVNSYKDNRIAGNGFGQVSTTLTAATLY